MLELVIIDTLVVVLLAALVAGLLRSHADILRALHALGMGVGDPSSTSSRASPSAENAGSADDARSSHAGANRAAAPAAFRLGAALPAERSSGSAHDVEGVGPDGEALVVSVAGVARFTLLAFLSSGCTTCAGFWDALAEPHRHGLPTEVRPLIVTKGPELELPAEVKRRAPAGVTLVMSSKAWDEYEVPGSPFFVLVDGPNARRAGEGVGRQFEQVAELVRRALADAGTPQCQPDSVPSASAGRAFSRGLDGKAREALNDRDLMEAGIHPGHPSLYPESLDDVFAGPPVGPQPREGHG